MLPTVGMELASTLLLIVGVIAFGVLLIVALSFEAVDATQPPGARLRLPRETLDEHLTKGEITQEEYFERRRALDFKTVIV